VLLGVAIVVVLVVGFMSQVTSGIVAPPVLEPGEQVGLLLLVAVIAVLIAAYFLFNQPTSYSSHVTSGMVGSI
jgi:hypothetical protein